MSVKPAYKIMSIHVSIILILRFISYSTVSRRISDVINWFFCNQKKDYIELVVFKSCYVNLEAVKIHHQI